jgi:hypothetical protein
MLRKGYHPLGEKSGFILKQLPSNIYSEVKEVVDIVQSDFTKSTPYNQNLVGQINKEYSTKLGIKSTQYLINTAKEYATYNPSILNKLLQYNPLPHNPILEYHGECWVNFRV